ncbi:hypothetical protein PENANT_c132G02051 [Penicillium antarcticum]|uniref:Uncharacterized protein n=1 Tax=Penicillium antarcticum TaxID=416450 RepID=A0A1V6PIB9_9EURO|nr:hypothetical protein PENANT_c132G02051 [Penicillium antarcticum]
MGTRDQCPFGLISYPSSYLSPRYASAYAPVVESHDFVYEQPLPASFLAAPLALSPSAPTSGPAPTYRSIRPRPKNDGLDTDNLNEPLKYKPGKRRRKMNRKSRQLSQEGRDKPNVPRPESKATQCSSVPFSQYADSDVCSSNREPTFTPCPPSSSNDLASPKWNQWLPLPINVSEAHVTDWSIYPHDVRHSLISPDIHFPLPTGPLQLSQDHDSQDIDFVGIAAYLETKQVLQSLTILQDYMAKRPSMFEEKDPKTIQRWMAYIKDLSTPEPLFE